MIDKTYDLKLALKEVSASSAGGSPFLIAYGATFLITAILSFFFQADCRADCHVSRRHRAAGCLLAGTQDGFSPHVAR